mmetsp:Transcript_91589/g.284939  ORF Transcript_91589/g.284939 Transcript_91589/m.284939 type:complete len:211 (+) Transcript_91589:857-1489(+)
MQHKPNITPQCLQPRITEAPHVIQDSLLLLRVQLDGVQLCRYLRVPACNLRADVPKAGSYVGQHVIPLVRADLTSAYLHHVVCRHLCELPTVEKLGGRNQGWRLVSCNRLSKACQGQAGTCSQRQKAKHCRSPPLPHALWDLLIVRILCVLRCFNDEWLLVLHGARYVVQPRHCCHRSTANKSLQPLLHRPHYLRVDVRERMGQAAYASS